jgi:DNA gyrase inhibitor
MEPLFFLLKFSENFLKVKCIFFYNMLHSIRNNQIHEEGKKETMKVKVETLPSYRIAYMRRVGPYGPANKEVMEKIKKWAMEKDLLHSAIFLAIPQDNPETTLPENCRFDACIVISKDEPIDNTVCEGEHPGGKYLIYEVKHTEQDIQKAYEDIFPSLQSSDYIMDNKPIIERYISDMIDNPYCEICVPIKE